MSFSTKITMLYFVAISIGLTVAWEFSGDGTFYHDDPHHMGACGWYNNDKELVAALNRPQYGIQQNPHDAKVCGKCAEVFHNEHTVKVRIVDECPECLHGSLDLSPTAFLHLAPAVEGRIKIQWSWTTC